MRPRLEGPRHPRGALLAAIGTTVLVGCGTAPPTTPPGEISAAPTPTPAPDLPACKAERITLTAPRTEGAAGTRFVVLRAVVDRGDACLLPGAPEIHVLLPDAAEDLATAPAGSAPGYAVAVGEPAVITVALSDICGAAPEGDVYIGIETLDGSTVVATLRAADALPPCLGGGPRVEVVAPGWTPG